MNRFDHITARINESKRIISFDSPKDNISDIVYDKALPSNERIIADIKGKLAAKDIFCVGYTWMKINKIVILIA